MCFLKPCIYHQKIYSLVRISNFHKIKTFCVLQTVRHLTHFLLWIVESCYFFQGRFSKSTFPPHRIIPTFFRSSEVRAWNFSVNTAATPTAAEDSIISFIRSQTSLHAEIISSSVTVMTSVTLSRMIGQVFLPKPILRPSAIVLGEAERNKEIAV